MGKVFLHRRLYLVLVLVGVTLFAGMATSFGLFFRLVYVFALTTVLGFTWNWLSVLWLNVRVDRRTARVSVGDNVEERISIRNLGPLPRPMLEVEDLTDLPGYSSGMAISLASRGYRSWKTLTPARKRGVYTMGPVRVASADSFGLFRREREFCGTETLIVYPRTFNVPGFSIPAANVFGESTARRRTHDLTPHAASVRDYAFGDSISRVHWNSTARMGKLMSKEFELGHSSEVWFFVDLHRDVQAGELEESTDEYGVSVATSLARKYLNAQMPVGLITYGDRRYFVPSETGAGQFDRIIEYLAMSKTEGLIALEKALPREDQLWGDHSSLVIITSSHRLEWVMAVRELTRRRVRVAVVLLDGISFGGIFNTLDVVPELHVSGVPPYVVRKGDDIPAALSHFYTAPELEKSGELEAMEARL